MIPIRGIENIHDGAKIRVSSRNTPHGELFSSFDYADTLTFDVEISSRYLVKSGKMIIFRDDDGVCIIQNGVFTPDYGIDHLTFTFDCKALCAEAEEDGLFYYYFLLDTHLGPLYLGLDEFGPDILSPKLSQSTDRLSKFQLTVYRATHQPPKRFAGRIMYQIFVDRFHKGSREVPLRKDAVMEEDWYEGIPPYYRPGDEKFQNNTFFGGTLWGVIEKLDYLKSLGVGILYLNPIFTAFSNHKYDTGDYMSVDSMFGGDKALDTLLAECHKRDILVMLDGVFNHTGDDSLYFNRYGKYDSVGAYQSKESPYYPWYRFINHPDEYHSWWGVKVLPGVDTNNADFDRFINGEDGVISHYTRKGVDAWRLDVADELAEGFIRNLRSAARKEDADAMVLGEVWEDASYKISYGKRRHYFRGQELDSVMNYPLKNAIISYLTSGDAANLYMTTRLLYYHYPKFVSDNLMNLLGTHDTCRILTELAGAPLAKDNKDIKAVAKLSAQERKMATHRLKIAYFLLCCMPGIPCIYYGDEIGMEGYEDPFNRRPYPWGREDGELLAFYRQMGKIRLDLPLLADGYYMPLSHEKGVFTFKRFDDKGNELTGAVNLGKEKIEIILGKKGSSVFADNAPLSYRHTLFPGEFDLYIS
ncbi:MAG: glycoside hydrolase family 13 protein [Ruminococcaceae bacterium]|nr:glycoside hydrolase family 13 protein [Oscillospiraceae bacterium]